MELVAIIVSITSLITSIYMMRKFSGPIAVDIRIPDIQVVVPWLQSEVQEITSEPLPVANGNDQSSSAWKNQTGIPINETRYVPSPGQKAPVPGPLERPAGFAR